MKVQSFWELGENILKTFKINSHYSNCDFVKIQNKQGGLED
jgi:hypothetical protein